MSSTHSHSPIDNNPNTDLETILKTPITPAKKSLNLLKNPKKREIIYGVTDRQNDPFLVKVNDFLIDHGRVTLKEKSLFFNSLRLLVNSGVPFTKSLRMLAKRTTNIKLFRVINTMVYDMEKNGQSFSGAMIKHPSIFSSSETKMIYSGEISGKIEKTLNSIATQLQKSIEFEMQIKSALLYPATVFTAIIIAGIIVVMFIIPQFVSLFAEFGGDLPLSTKTLLWISDFMIQFWWILLCFLIGSVFAFSSWKKTEEGRKEWDRFILNLPLFFILSASLLSFIDTGLPFCKCRFNK